MTTTDRTAGPTPQDSGDRFAAVDSRADFVAMEQDTLRWWNENDMNARYRVKNNDAKEHFSFIDDREQAEARAHPDTGED